MPLRRGYKPIIIRDNIERLVKEGYSIQQAAAIAYKKARDYRRSVRRK